MPGQGSRFATDCYRDPLAISFLNPRYANGVAPGSDGESSYEHGHSETRLRESLAKSTAQFIGFGLESQPAEKAACGGPVVLVYG
jgi:hypothetical protein